MPVVILCLNFVSCLKTFMKLWGLSDCGERITLTDNTAIFPVGVTEGVFKIFLGRTVSTDYLVIECAGTGHITLGRSLLKLMGAVIDVGKGTLKFTASPGCGHLFPKPSGKLKGKRSKRKRAIDLDVPSSFGNT